MSDAKRFIDVAAGLILTRDGRLLLAQRPGDKAWSGWWELPGGKLEPGETPTQALVRELKEELDITVTVSTPWVTYTHEYPKTVVRLAFHRVTAWEGEPSGIEGQALAWTTIHGPASVSPLLPATEPPLRWLRLPDHYLLTSIGSPDGLQPFLHKLDAALQAGVRLVQFREPAWAKQCNNAEDPALYDAFQQVLKRCRQVGAGCLVNSVHPAAWAEQADGIHYRAADASTIATAAAQAGAHPLDMATTANGPQPSASFGDKDGASSGKGDATVDQDESINDRADPVTPALPGAMRGHRYVGMSAHTEHDLQVARQIQADFVVLGHVLDTPSHPDVPCMGWHRFSELNQQAGLPAFAIGGQSSATLQTATASGAHGIAGIRLIDDLG